MAPQAENAALESTFEKLSIKEDVPKNFDGTLKIIYTEEELEVIRQVKKQLIEKHEIDESRIGLKTLALTTIVTELRVDEAAEKYVKYLQSTADCGVANLTDEEALIMKDEDLQKCIKSIAACGRDNLGRSVMWIRGNTAFPEEVESYLIRASVMYHVAIHADAVSLREGITFVSDTSQRPAKRAKNEAKLQRTWQSMPMRPQAFLIVGASLPLRVIINSLVLVGSYVTKQKILDRIKFVKISDALKAMPDESQPEYLGGKGGNIQDIMQWTKDRIEAFPVPNL